ncbi:hypothetical protein [Pleomorphochaeta sp. DL1XJH-081]|uniref:hypothetical protein n=1 Tax=Pleomorphochaeta sp. DL1XJH-081 TaxID=3409690 RepID=UPI003BB79190
MGTMNYHQYTHDQRIAYLKEFDESGQSVRAFCETIGARQYEVTSQFAKRGFTEHTGNKNNLNRMRLPHANGGHYEYSNPHWYRCPQG